jgi:hypothetical protein
MLRYVYALWKAYISVLKCKALHLVLQRNR